VDQSTDGGERASPAQDGEPGFELVALAGPGGDEGKLDARLRDRGQKAARLGAAPELAQLRGCRGGRRAGADVGTAPVQAGCWYVVSMPFYVHAQDRPDVGTELLDLAKAHWSYMDRFADRLILRGPTLSDDGTEHTGSVHVVNLADRASAERFATGEPYWLAGLYRHVTTVRTVVLFHRETTEGSLTSGVPNALILIIGQWPPEPRNASDTDLQPLGVNPDSRLCFVAVLVDDNQSHTTGIVSIVSAFPGEARRIIQPFADQLTREPVALTAQRWRRGGRS
jgi:uncharacterized protein YciI